jgi:hypothetical protein
MTDMTASNSAPEPQDQAYSQDGSSPVDRVSSVSDQAWEPVIFPGQIAIDASEADDESGVDSSSPAVDNLSQATEAFLHTNPEPAIDGSHDNTHELIELIQDLNQCNDALLLRVAELEESLERSQLALQAEIERNQGQGATPGIREAAPVPQQIAQLLSELDIANDGLRRTTIHNETLQAELDASQQRVAQLERECTLLQQRFSEKSTALQQAEDTCRDLRARLHRQQRYTLQFKTALEKCLNTTVAETGVVGAPMVSVAESAAPTGQAVAMPKAQHIKPWSMGDRARSDSASLTHLLHSLRAPGQGPPPAAPTATPHQRVSEQTFPDMATPAMMPSSVAASAGQSIVDPQPDTTSSVDGGQPLAPAHDFSHHPASSPPKSLEAEVEDGLQQDLWHSAPESTLPMEPTPGFTEPSPWGPTIPQSEPQSITEPSPWGAPLPEPVSDPEPATVVQASPSFIPEPATASPEASPIPRPRPDVALPTYLQPANNPSPSPVVYPLRSQKKLTSMAAVQLPSFGRNSRRS